MKSVVYFMFATTLLLFASCSSDNDIDVNLEETGEKVKVTLTVGAPTKASFATVNGDSLAGAQWEEDDFLWIYYPQTNGEHAIGKLAIDKSYAGKTTAQFSGELTNPATGEVQVVCTNNMFTDADVTTEGFDINLQHQSGHVTGRKVRPEATYYSANDLRFDYGKCQIAVDGSNATFSACQMKQLFAQLVIQDQGKASCDHRLAVENIPSTGFFSWEKGHITNVGGHNTIIVAATHNNRFNDTADSDQGAKRYVTVIPFDVTDTEEHGHAPISLHLDYSVTSTDNNVDYYHFDSKEKWGKTIAKLEAGKYYNISIKDGDWRKVQNVDEILRNTPIVSVGGVNWATSNLYATINPGTVKNTDGTAGNKSFAEYAQVKLYDNMESLKSAFLADKSHYGWNMGYNMWSSGPTLSFSQGQICATVGSNHAHDLVLDVKQVNGSEESFVFDQFGYGCSDCFAYSNIAAGTLRNESDFAYSMRFFDVSKNNNYYSSKIKAGEDYGTKAGIDPNVYDVARLLNKEGSGYESQLGIWRMPRMEEFLRLTGVADWQNGGDGTLRERVVPTAFKCTVNGVEGWLFSDYDYAGNNWEAQSSKGKLEPQKYSLIKTDQTGFGGYQYYDIGDGTEIAEDGTVAGNTVFFPVESFRQQFQISYGYAYYATSTAKNDNEYYVFDSNFSQGYLLIKGLHGNLSGAPRSDGAMVRPVFQYHHETQDIAEH